MTAPYSKIFDDIYFAAEDGLAESRYVFLQQNNLPEAWAGKQNFTICETGFGTGLNFLCAWDLFEKTANSKDKLTYISFEKYPLSAAEILDYLSPWREKLGDKLNKLCQVYPLRIGGWHKIKLNAQIDLLLIFDDVNRAISELDTTTTSVDCWFLDGHAPAKNPDMWSEILFQNMANLSQKNARFATFTAAGLVKNRLINHGFEVIKSRGFGRKRDMLKGFFKGKSSVDVSKIFYTPHKKQTSIAIIGGGIAGAATVQSLLKYGAIIDLYESNQLASGGSGNVLGLYNPRITARRGFESDFYSSGFMHAYKRFQKLHQEEMKTDTRTASPLKLKLGNLHLFTAQNLLNEMARERRDHRLYAFPEAWGWHKEHAQIVDASEASEISGISLSRGGVFLPQAGSISPQNLVRNVLLSDNAAEENLRIRMENVSVLQQENLHWVINGRIYDAVILTCASGAKFFFNASYLNLQSVRGQISLVETPQVFAPLKVNLCYGGYASAPQDGYMVVGSTFQPWDEGCDLRDADHGWVLDKLGNEIDTFDGVVKIIGGRASTRCTTKERVPLIGETPHFSGLYLNIAHGSHGLISAIMGAEILASQIFWDIQPLPKSAIKQLNPRRLIKSDQPASLSRRLES